MNFVSLTESKNSLWLHYGVNLDTHEIIYELCTKLAEYTDTKVSICKVAIMVA